MTQRVVAINPVVQHHIVAQLEHLAPERIFDVLLRDAILREVGPPFVQPIPPKRKEVSLVGDRYGDEPAAPCHSNQFAEKRPSCRAVVVFEYAAVEHQVERPIREGQCKDIAHDGKKPRSLAVVYRSNSRVRMLLRAKRYLADVHRGAAETYGREKQTLASTTAPSFERLRSLL